MLAFVIFTAEFITVVAFALAAFLLNTIDRNGFLASTAVGFSLIYGGGPSWFVIVAVFFGLGVVFTLYKYRYKQELGTAQERGGARGWPNILANGGAASALALVNIFGSSSVISVLFLGAISTSAADTVATELGLLSQGKPKLITHLATTVPPGTSGGVTPLGVMGALFASLVIGGMAFFLGVGPMKPYVVLVCILGGVIGAFIDSFLGATVQRKGYCLVCHKPTEVLRHCGEKTSVTGGVPYVENNVVNFLATVGGAVCAFAVLLVISSLA